MHDTGHSQRCHTRHAVERHRRTGIHVPLSRDWWQQQQLQVLATPICLLVASLDERRESTHQRHPKETGKNRAFGTGSHFDDRHTYREQSAVSSSWLQGTLLCSSSRPQLQWCAVQAQRPGDDNNVRGGPIIPAILEANYWYGLKYALLNCILYLARELIFKSVKRVSILKNLENISRIFFFCAFCSKFEEDGRR